VEQQHHLSLAQQHELSVVLQAYSKLFSGKLGLYPHRKIHLELQDGATPVHLHPYSVAHAHEHLFKAELHRLCEIGVLQRCGASEWGAPTFIVPKNNGRV